VASVTINDFLLLFEDLLNELLMVVAETLCILTVFSLQFLIGGDLVIKVGLLLGIEWLLLLEVVCVLVFKIGILLLYLLLLLHFHLLLLLELKGILLWLRLLLIDLLSKNILLLLMKHIRVRS
jgi:hypothetical protein